MSVEKVKLEQPTKAKSKAKKGAGASPLAEAITKIENLTSETAFNEAASLLDQVEQSYFSLGGVLSVIQSNGFFTEKGYETFRDCVEAEFGIKYRKAMYLVAIYNNLVSAEIDWEVVKGLGWTKMTVLAPVMDKDNVSDLVEKAKDYTVNQLKEYVTQLQTPEGESGGKESPAPSDITSKTFKLHKDQKETIEDTLEQAKKDSNTDSDAVALENVCLSYLNTAPKTTAAPQKSLKELMESAGYEEALNTFAEIWPSIDLTVAVPDGM